MGDQKTALITGASSGIGFELARVFAKNGYRLVLVSKNKERLQSAEKKLKSEFPSTPIVSIPKDLSLSNSAFELFSECKKRKIQVDVLINDAGYGLLGKFHELLLKDQMEMLQVNISSLTCLTYLFLPEMIRRKKGYILNLASTASFQPGPLMAVYYASKAYVLSFSQAIANELEGSGVTVTALCPGPTKTNFQKRAGASNTKVFSGFLTSPEIVAQRGFDGLISKEPVVFVDSRSAFLAKLAVIMPRKTVVKYVRGIQEKRRKR
ncbi:SDR family oxidoreductase [Candidatus Micrarchaeota archaeon]|nr:SDR family oxidoreductase [Candidatus Micrarchaeota archaeon]